MSPPVESPAPRTSSRGLACPSSRSLGRIRNPRMLRLPVNTTDRRKMYRQPSDEVRKPPNINPVQNPIPPAEA